VSDRDEAIKTHETAAENDEAERSPVYRIRPDSFFTASADGVLLHNDKGAFAIRGPSAYRLVEWLFRALDGTRSVDEICRDLGPGPRAAIDRVLRALDTNSFLRRVARLAEDVPCWAKELFGDHIDFLGHHLDSPFAGFLQFRRRRALCVGYGTALRAVMVALIESGAGRVDAVVTSTDDHERKAVARIVESARKRDPRLELTSALCASPNPRLRHAATHADYVLYSGADAGSVLEESAAVSRAHRLPFAAVFAAEPLVIATPVSKPGSPVCWNCVRAWLPAVLPTLGERSLPADAAADGRLAPAPTAIAAYRVVHDFFCDYTGLAVSPGLSMTVDQATLATRTHRIATHPLCPWHATGAAHSIPEPAGIATAVGGPRPDLPRADDDPDAAAIQDDIVAATAERTDPVFGPLLSVDEEDVPQLPLAGTRCVARRLTQVTTAQTERPLLCQGISARETRNQVVLLALESMITDALAAGLAVDGGPWTNGDQAVGVGWSLGEAAYRALSAVTRQWAARHGPKRPSRILAEIGHDSAIGTYLIEVLAGLRLFPQLAVARAPTGLHAATAFDATRIAYGSGASEQQAILNALLGLCTLHLHDGQAGIHSAELGPDSRSWHDALTTAQTARVQQGIKAHWHAIDGAFRLLPPGMRAVGLTLVAP
jgi:hypothetical protein